MENIASLAAPGIDREIYVMPAFVTFEVGDVRAIARWYEAAGFVVLAVMPGEGGEPGLVHLRRQRYQDILLVPARGHSAGDQVKGRGSVTMAAGGDDLARRAELVRAVGAGEVSGPSPTPWRTSDLRLTDPEGNVVVFTEPRMLDKDDPAWTATVRESLAHTLD